MTVINNSETPISPSSPPHISYLQVGFFSGICLPCYDLLAKLVPELTPMLENCADNLASWKQLAEQRKLEAQDETEI